MKKISSKLTSKFQITLPKTIRNYLNIEDFDIVDFIVNEEEKRVYIEKGKHRQQCPICNEGNFYSDKCIVCDGEGFVDSLNEVILTSSLLKAALSSKSQIELVLKNDIYFIKLETENALLMLYRDKIQLEIIKLTLEEIKKNNFTSPTLEELEEMLDEKCNRKYINTWYEQTFNKGV